MHKNSAFASSDDGGRIWATITTLFADGKDEHADPPA